MFAKARLVGIKSAVNNKITNPSHEIANHKARQKQWPKQKLIKSPCQICCSQKVLFCWSRVKQIFIDHDEILMWREPKLTKWKADKLWVLHTIHLFYNGHHIGERMFSFFLSTRSAKFCLIVSQLWHVVV